MIPSSPSRPAPLRGTQSLVGVMGFVWRNPSLTAIELLWRWSAAVPLLALLYHVLAPIVRAIPLDTAALNTMTFLEPVRSFEVLDRQLRPFLPPIEATLTWWLPLALLLWTAAATLGRTTILRRTFRLWPANNLSSRPEAAGRSGETPVFLRTPAAPSSREGSGRVLPAIALYICLRALAFFILLALWLLGLRAATRSTVTHPLYAGGEPNLVLLTFLAVTLTLALFLLWSLTIWALDLAPLRRLTGLTLPTGAHRRELRSKLVETNLVMGIVRVALLVLALTFSASPLPFQTRETQAFIDVWWTGVALLYVLGSDFFHVVRRVTYLRLLQSIANAANDPAPPAS